VSDFDNQANQVIAEYRTRLAQLRLEAQREIQLLNEKLVAASDVVDRTLITAPQSGKVLNLTFTTVGGVVKPGEPIMEIVPESETIVASIKINPADRASVREGLVVRAQITAFDNRDVPELKGEIINISGDLITDARTQETYYDARVRLDTDDIHKARILPGLPVSAFIFSGAERTTLEHVLDPLNESMFKGLRGR
jgi:HlyD family type I secretion membrane fusion protein